MTILTIYSHHTFGFRDVKWILKLTIQRKRRNKNHVPLLRSYTNTGNTREILMEGRMDECHQLFQSFWISESDVIFFTLKVCSLIKSIID